MPEENTRQIRTRSTRSLGYCFAGLLWSCGPSLISSAAMTQGRSRSREADRSRQRIGSKTHARRQCAPTRVKLADIYNWFAEGFDSADLKNAKALLEEMAG